MTTVVLQRGDQLPDFEAPTIGGPVFRYGDVWQQRNLLVINTTTASPGGVDYIERLRTRVAALKPDNSIVVALQNASALPGSSILIADRWGEIVFIAPIGEDVTHWPLPDDLLEWLNMVRCRC